MDALQGQLKTLREMIDVFPVGAATSAEHSLEDEIRQTVNTITLVRAKLLMLKAQDRERKLPQDSESLNLSRMAEVVDEYEEEIAKASVQKLAWKNCIEACHIQRLIADVPDDPENFAESFQSIAQLLTEVNSLTDCLMDTLKEQQDTTKQIMAKKQELQHKLLNYKGLLVAQEAEWQERATGVERENIALKKRLQSKLEKLNVMRILMVTILGCSNINYIKCPEWTSLLIEKQGLLTMQSLVPLKMINIEKLFLLFMYVVVLD